MNHSRSIARAGFTEILVAIGIVSMLGLFSLTNNMSAGLANRKKIAKLDRIESFYTGELAAWRFPDITT